MTLITAAASELLSTIKLTAVEASHSGKTRFKPASARLPSGKRARLRCVVFPKSYSGWWPRSPVRL